MNDGMPIRGRAAIRVMDLELTGFEPPEHAPIEIGWCDLVSTRNDLAGAPAGWVVQPPRSLVVCPGRPIPPESSAIHHLIDEDVADAPPWDYAARVALADDGTKRVAYAAHSAKTERQWLTPDLTGTQPWICTWKCAIRLWPEAPAHSNQALRYWRRPPGLDRAIAGNGHRAGQDAYVTAHLLAAMLETRPLEDLVKFTAEPALLPRVTFGKYTRGKLWSEVDDGFLYWVLDRDFDEDVRFTALHELRRREAEYEQHDQAPYDAGPGMVSTQEAGGTNGENSNASE